MTTHSALECGAGSPLILRPLPTWFAQSVVTDRMQMFFYTNATRFDKRPTGGYNGTDDGLGNGKGAKDCSQVGQIFQCMGSMTRPGVERVIRCMQRSIPTKPPPLHYYTHDAGVMASWRARACGTEQ